MEDAYILQNLQQMGIILVDKKLIEQIMLNI